jgi:hypothetical protein
MKGDWRSFFGATANFKIRKWCDVQVPEVFPRGDKVKDILSENQQLTEVFSKIN